MSSRPLEVDFEVAFPYRHSTGPAVGRFLAGLRDRVVWGRRCAFCDRVVVPASDHCETCGSGLSDWVEVGPEGTVAAITVADGIAFVAVRLDGAGTDLVHRGDPGLVRGMRVRPAWADEPAGSILDLERFVPADDVVADRPPAGEPVEAIRTDLRLPFRFSAGRLLTRFAEGLRAGEIHGVRCPECRSLYVPPRPTCPRCWERTEGWVRVADEGVVETFVVVNVPFPGQEVEIPYVLGHVRLDGAGSSFLHLVGVPPSEARIGMRVRAAWRPPRERRGFLSEDVDHFDPS
jgi:uncharacterized OB-fold protein